MSRTTDTTADAKDRQTILKAGAALIAGLALLLLVQIGLAVGSAESASPSTALAAGDSAILRHALVLRDGARPIVIAETGDRSLASSAPPPKALLPDGIFLGPSSDRTVVAFSMDDRPARLSVAAAFEARAPPVPAA